MLSGQNLCEITGDEKVCEQGNLGTKNFQKKVKKSYRKLIMLQKILNSFHLKLLAEILVPCKNRNFLPRTLVKKSIFSAI